MLSGRLRAAVVLAGARNADANAHIPSVRRRTKGIRILLRQTTKSSVNLRCACSWALRVALRFCPLCQPPWRKASMLSRSLVTKSIYGERRIDQNVSQLAAV